LREEVYDILELVFTFKKAFSQAERLEKLSDADLVKLAISDDLAFEYLVYRYQGFMKAAIFSLVSSRDEGEELFQEVLWKLYNSLGTYKPEYGFKPWLRKIILTTFLSMKRRSKKTVSIEELSERGIDLRAEDSSQEEVELESVLREALSSLSKETRAIIYLRFKEGLTHEEIAKELGMKVETVRKRFSRALSALRKVMKS